jgi:iron complex transport system permease protein
VITGTATPPASGVAVVRRPRRVRGLWLLVAALVLVAAMLCSVTIGSRDVEWSAVLGAFAGGVDGFDQAAVAKRIPRTLLAVLAGAALGVSGAVMQGVTRNPLADPGILGINLGASLAVVTGLAYFGLAAASTTIWVAIIGGVGGGTAVQIEQVLPFLVVGFLVCLLSARGLNSLALGDDLAAGLGERVAVARGAAALGSVVLCGAATAVTGPIGFVGLVVPHACRLVVGVDHRWLLPFSAVVGAVLLTAADVLGRIVARPSEIDVGIITALIGAPIFIAIVRRQKVSAL